MKIPVIGLGTSLKNPNGFRSTGENDNEFENALNEALKVGYRNFDTAFIYGTEKTIGKVINKWIDEGKIKRSELLYIWVLKSKNKMLPGIGIHVDKVEHFLNLSLANFQLDYVDLYLMHQPIGVVYHSDTDFHPKKPDGTNDLVPKTDIEGIWKAMESQVKGGKCKSIGISNFNTMQIERILKIAEIPPTYTQVEMNLYFQQKEFRDFCGKNNITIIAFSPLGAPGLDAFHQRIHDTIPPALLEDPLVIKLAQNYSKTPSQILLRFLTQLNVVPIPKSMSVSRMKSNFEIFDFKIGDEDMIMLEGLDKGEKGRFFTLRGLNGYAEHPDYPW